MHMMVYSLISCYIIIIFHFQITKNCQATNGMSISFLMQSTQSHIVQEIPSILKDIENKVNFKIKDNYITIDYDDIGNSLSQVCRTIAETQSLLVDLSYYPWEDGLHYIRKSKIPYLRVDVTLNQFLKALEDYLIVRKANDACFIFQSENDLEDAIYYMILKNVNLRLVFFNGMKKDFIEKFSNMRLVPSYYGIFATTDNMKKIVEKLLQSKLLKRPDKWHFVFVDAIRKEFNVNNYLEGMVKISAEIESTCELSENSTPCNSAENIPLQKITLKEVLTTTITQFEKLNLTSGSFNCEENSETNVSFNELINLSYLFNNSNNLKNEEGTVIFDLNLKFSYINKKTGITNILARWDSSEKLSNISANVRPARRFFRIGTIESIPWAYFKKDSITRKLLYDNDGNPIWEGYCIDLIQKLSEKLNFDYEIISPKYGTFGEKQSDGSWDGLVGDLLYGYTDMVVSSLKMTSEREEVIDFIAPYFEQTGISIVIRNPVRQTSLFKFMTVLRTEVWFSIIGALVATAIMIWLLDKYSPYSATNNKKAYSYPCREFTLKESFWFALTSFTPQGGGEAPKAISGRVLVAAYWLFVVLMLATFTANLAAFLTVERMQTPVQSLEQLARQSRINYTVVANSDTHEYFINMKYAEDTLYRMWKELTLNATADQRKYRIWDYPIKEQYGHILLAINSSNPVKDAREGFLKVNEHENADFAFIHDSAEIKYEITKNCNLTEVGEVFAEQPYAIAVQQGSQIQDELSYAVLELQRDRYFENLNAKFWNNSARKDCSTSEENEGITLESLGGVFIATLCGLALAMVTLGIEVAYYKAKAKKKKTMKPIITNVKGKIFVKKINVSPPPSFEKAISNTNTPKHILLGSNTFRPARLRRTEAFMLANSKPLSKSNDLPPYYE